MIEIVLASWTDVIRESFEDMLETTIEYLPVILGAVILLIVGLIAGHILGKVVSKILDKIGVDDAVNKTPIGDTIKRSGMTVVGFFDAIVRWFVYLLFITAAVNVLDIPMFTNLMERIVLYIPHLILGVLVLIIGLVLVDFIVDHVKKQLVSREIEFAKIITSALRVIFYLVVIVFALDQLQIETTIIYTLLVPLSWGIAGGIAIAMGIALGWGLKDITANYAKKKIEKEK